MAQAIRAIYHNGQLQLLDKVDLDEGQEIELMIVSNKESLRSALGDLLVEIHEINDGDIDEELLLKEIAEDFKGLPPLSQSIIDERQDSL